MKNIAGTEVLNKLEQNGITLHKGRIVLYKYVSAEVAKIILESGYIRFSTPETFNDTRDMCLDLIDTDLTGEEIDNYILQSIKGRIRDEDIPKVYSWARKTDWNMIFQMTANNQRKKSLIFCTSQSNKIEKLWTFYADESKGVCIGILLPMVYEELQMITAHVKYTDTMIPVKLLLDSTDSLFYSIMNWVYTKSKKYADEREVRTYINLYHNDFELEDGKFWYMGLQPFMIHEIYYGSRTSIFDVMEIEKIISKKGWEIKKKGKLFYPKRSFELDVEDIQT